MQKTKVKSSKHYFQQDINTSKHQLLLWFLYEYRKAVIYYVNKLWDKPFITINKKTNKQSIFDIKNNLLDCPQYINISDHNKPYKTLLSTRALTCAAAQACGIVKAAVSKRSKQLYIIDKLTKENKPIPKKLAENIKKPLIKPTIPKQLNAELSSHCADVQNSNGNFNSFIRLKCIGKVFGHIKIPIKYHKHSLKLKSLGKQLNSFLVCQDNIQIRYEIPIAIKKSQGNVIGADQGMNKALVLSDNQQTTKNIHNHDFKSITKKLLKKKPGSKSYKKTQEHRENYINYAINQLDFSNIKQLNLEDLTQMRFNRKNNKYLTHFTYSLILKKLEDKSEDEGFILNLLPPYFRSQRCSNCEFVFKSSRKGEEYKCINCGFKIDSDLNATRNNAKNLCKLPFGLKQMTEYTGFFWKEAGIFDHFGQEIIVPDTRKNKKYR